MFNESEIRFLMGRHKVEHATGNRMTSEMIDLRSLGCPLPIFERILNHRALQLGRAFTQFRMANRETLTVTNTDVEAVKLF
jgi:hypothetical protein